MGVKTHSKCGFPQRSSFMTSPRPLPAIRVLSSMATKAVLADLCRAYSDVTGQAVTVESVGGVDAANRVMADEAVDVVCLGAAAMTKLAAGGKLSGPIAPIALSETVAAVPATLDRALAPDIGTADALKQAVLQANALAYSTGPSGVALAALFAEWGIAQTIAPRIKIPPPGTPVASLLASGEVSLGFQQHAELIGVHGVHILGSLPASVAINTVFSAAVATQAANTVAAQQLVDALAAPSSAETKQRNGMRQPA